MTSEEANRLIGEFPFVAEAREIVAALERLDRWDTDVRMSESLELDFRLSALRSLRQLLGTAASESGEIIRECLLPVCVRVPGDPKDLDSRVALLQCRELAGEWLNVLDGPASHNVMVAALRYLSSQLGSPILCRPACWTISEIGYRNEQVVEKLWQLADADDVEVSDTALETLTALGLTGDERQRCLVTALDRAQTRLSGALGAALVTVPSEEIIPRLAKAWLSSDRVELEDRSEILLSVFAQVGALLENPDAVDEACSAIARLRKLAPPTFGRRLRLASNVLPYLDSPLATELLLELMTEETAATDYDRWLVQLRLQECWHPRQMEGLDGEAARSRTLLAMLETQLLLPGEFQGRRGSTHEGDLKLGSLRAAFLVAAPEAISWLGPALEHEANPYLQREIMEAYATTRVAPLPALIAKLITEKSHLGKEPADNIELMRRLDASRLRVALEQRKLSTSSSVPACCARER
jgi:hypothetical protein